MLKKTRMSPRRAQHSWAPDETSRGRALDPLRQCCLYVAQFEMKAACAILAGVWFLVAPVSLRAELVNGIVAVVHDSVITYEQVRELTEQTDETLRRQYPEQGLLYQQKLEQSRAENIDKLEQNELILHEFKTAGYSLPESVIEDEIKDEIRERFGDRVTATKTLQARGMTYEKYREQVRERFIIGVMRHKNVASEIIISPHKVEVYYLNHKNDFKVEDQVKLRMIVLTKISESSAPQVRKLAEEILQKLSEGAAFDEMAKIYSQGSQRGQGGDWGWVERSVLRKELAEPAFSLKAGQRSGVIETPDAFYLMLVEDTRPAHCKPLVDVREQIEKTLLLDEQKRLEQQWIARLKKKTFVRSF
jgi:parvulin-like peptidyl-prolyl isomerase